MSRVLSGAVAVAALWASWGPARADSRDPHPGDCGSGPSTNASGSGKLTDREALRVVGLTASGQLVCFSDRKPHRASVIGTVGGFSGADVRLVGMDFRPQDGLLYGVGNAGGLYLVDTGSAMLTPVGQLSTAPDAAATAFGADFNPAANALRIVSNTGQNLRQSFANLGTANPLAPTAVDGTLGYTAAAAPGPTAPGIVGTAYTNNDLAAVTATSLFVLDANLRQVALQSPANAGFLVATGQLGVMASAGGFDIYSILRKDVTVTQRALASLWVDGRAQLYSIDLLTGRAYPRGEIGAAVVDIAVPLNQF